MIIPKTALEILARIGYAAKGVVYVLMGGLGLIAVARAGAKPGGAKAVFEALLTKPFGRVILVIMALGLAGYTLWRLAQAVVNPENKGSRFHVILLRIGFFGSACIHGAWVVGAAQMAFGFGGGADDYWVARWTKLAFYEGLWGRLLVALVGVIVLGVAVYQYWLAFNGGYRKRLCVEQLGKVYSEVLLRLSQIGIAARAIVFSLMGVFLMRAAWELRSGEAKGWTETLKTIHRHPFGPQLLGAIAVGLIFYGIYQFAKSRYREIC